MNTHRRQDMVRSLRIVRRDLDSLIAPELKTATAQSTLSMIGKLLEMLAQELTTDFVAASPTTDAAAPVQAALARSGHADDHVLARNIGELSQRAVDQGEARSALHGLFEAAARRQAVSADAAVWRGFDALSAMRALRESGSADAAWDASYLESGAGSRSATSQQVGEREFSAEELANYINTTRRSPGTARVRRLERLPGGYSKGTYLVELQVSSETQEQWVIRRDLRFSPLQTRVIDEFPLLLALHQRGLPVPEPLWAEPDAACLGAPMIAVRRVGGSGDMAQWSQTPHEARSIALSAARLLAQIHMQDLSTLPKLQTDAPGCSGETPLQVVAHLEAFWKAVRIEPDPLVELVFDWLYRHAPQAGSRTLVHGDYGLHNLLVENGKVNAVLDWEFAHAGDPREDLAYARPFVEKVLPWQDFLAAYEAAGGGSCDDMALRFYTVLGIFRNALGCMKVLHCLRHDDSGIDSKFVYVGRSYAQHQLRTAAQLTGAMKDGKP